MLFGGIGIGGTINWANGKYSLYGEANFNTNLENISADNTFGGTVGFRMQW